MNIYLKKYQQGVGLIEVLVTVLVLSTSLMALAALQTRALQFNQGAYIESQANIYAYDILDRIRVNALGNAEVISAYTVAKDAATPTTNNTAKNDITAWRENIRDNLPGGKGAIACVKNTKVCTITISWNDFEGLVVSSKTAGTSQFEYVAML